MAGEGRNDDGSRPLIRARRGSTGTVEQAKVQKAGRCSRGALLGIKVAAALQLQPVVQIFDSPKVGSTSSIGLDKGLLVDSAI